MAPMRRPSCEAWLLTPFQSEALSQGMCRATEGQTPV
jgi:hypothetical protein